MKGALRVTSKSDYTVHEISTAYGTSVREYTVRAARCSRWLATGR